MPASENPPPLRNLCRIVRSFARILHRSHTSSTNRRPSETLSSHELQQVQQFLTQLIPRLRHQELYYQQQSRLRHPRRQCLPLTVLQHNQSRSPSSNCPRHSCPSTGYIIAYVHSPAPHQPIAPHSHQATCYIASHVKLSRSQSSPELQSASFLPPVRHRHCSIDVYPTSYGSIIAIDSSLPDPYVKPDFNRHVCVLTTKDSHLNSQSGSFQANAMCKVILPSYTIPTTTIHSDSRTHKLPLRLSIPSTPSHHSTLLDLSRQSNVNDAITSFHSEVASIRRQDLSFNPQQSIKNYLEIPYSLNQVPILSNLLQILLETQIIRHAPFFP